MMTGPKLFLQPLRQAGGEEAFADEGGFDVAESIQRQLGQAAFERIAEQQRPGEDRGAGWRRRRR